MKSYVRSGTITTNFEDIGGLGLDFPVNLSSDVKNYLVTISLKRISYTGGTPLLQYSVSADLGSISGSTGEDILTVSTVVSCTYGGTALSVSASLAADEGSVVEIVLGVIELC